MLLSDQYKEGNNRPSFVNLKSFVETEIDVTPKTTRTLEKINVLNY